MRRMRRARSISNVASDVFIIVDCVAGLTRVALVDRDSIA